VCQIFTISGAAVRTANHSANSTALPPRYVNVMADDYVQVAGMQPWEAAVTGWLAPACAGGAIDGVGIDHYPGTWAPTAFTNWSPLDKLAQLVTGANATNGSAPSVWLGKLPAVMETGYSSFSFLATEAQQLAWVQQSLPALRAKVNASRALAPGGGGVQYVGFYQLVDVCSSCGLAHVPPEEDHFGIVHTDFSPKAAFAELKAQLALF
jgi:hypothetical protein